MKLGRSTKLLFKVLKYLKGVQSKMHVDFGGPLSPDPPCTGSRRTHANQILLEDDNILCPHLSQIVSNADPDDPSSDDHNVSRSCHFRVSPLMAIYVYSEIRASLIMSRIFSTKPYMLPCFLILPISRRYMYSETSMAFVMFC